MFKYSSEVNSQIVLSLLKAHGIRRVVASPGATNVTLVGSMQQDPYFEVYSSVDERSAAYLACGLAAESGEPVVISCTGATASRNYLPGLTEAFYRKLPVLAITSTQIVSRVGHHIAQVIDRSTIQNDVAKLSVTLPVVQSEEDQWECEIKVNMAILELKRSGGGPAHINLPTLYSQNYDVQELPQFRVIKRYEGSDELPKMPSGRIGIFVGSHGDMSSKLTEVIDRFCEKYNAVVFCDHTSGYNGKFKVLFSVVAGQTGLDLSDIRPELLIHVGEVSGDYYTLGMAGEEVWRVSDDGEIRDTFKKLTAVFQMSLSSFFSRMTEGVDAPSAKAPSYLELCRQKIEIVRAKLPELPFSNIWLASKIAGKIPANSVVHFGILNSLRAWNFFDLPSTVRSASNVGGFGIDGGLSSLIGASWVNPNKLYFCVLGDLAFFYDMNVAGNRHVGKNIRILLVNNGKGTEFRNHGHTASHFGEDADKFIAAAGHFGNKSRSLVRHYAEDLGFEYFSAESKDSFLAASEKFLSPALSGKSQVFEVFTNSDEESDALEEMRSIEKTPRSAVKSFAKAVVGEGGVAAFRKMLGK